MNNIKKLLVIPFGIFILTNTSSASMWDQVVYNVVGQASNAAGARLGDEIYYGSSRSSSSHKHKNRAPAKRNYAPKVTDAMRVQKALSSLGFYHGRIDGAVNSFETRSAIKKMNIAYGISNSASLKPEAKDTLIFLGTLFDFDRHLISTANSKRAKNRKIQVALKLHGYYQGNIDGAIGKRTRGSIAEYKGNNGMTYSGTLDFEEEYQLVSTAKEKNDKNIEDSIASLEAMGRPVQQYVQRPNAQAPRQQIQQPMQRYQKVQTQQQPMHQVSTQLPVVNQAQTQNMNQVQPMAAVQQAPSSTMQQGMVANTSQPVSTPTIEQTHTNIQQ